VLAAYTGPHDWRHAESLFEGIEKLLIRAHWPIQSLTGVAVSIGPGSFTGIRIGLAAARVLGQALKIPVVGVSSLKVMAYGRCRHSGASRPQQGTVPAYSLKGMGRNPVHRLGPGFRRGDVKFICPMIDALRGQVFSALYERTLSGSLKCVFPETMAPVAEWFKKVQCRVHRQSLWISPLKGCYPEAGVLLTLALPKLALQGPESYKSVLPLYIRKAAASERRASPIRRAAVERRRR
jgi:tRNA threonylcarbamoyl adenosine modification protein YeaZ